MVVYILYMQAELEGVAKITLQPKADLCLTVRNPLDHSQVRKKVVIDPRALESPPGGSAAAAAHAKGHHEHLHSKHFHAPKPCHFSLKWTPDATTRASIRVWDAADDTQHLKLATPLTNEYTADDSGRRLAILALECENEIEPIAWHLMGHEFVVTTTDGQVHTQLDWNDGDDTWTSYDLASGSTTISHFKACFE